MQGRLEVATVVTSCHVLPDSSDRAVPWIAIGELWEGKGTDTEAPAGSPEALLGVGPGTPTAPVGPQEKGGLGQPERPVVPKSATRGKHAAEDGVSLPPETRFGHSFRQACFSSLEKKPTVSTDCGVL